MTKAKKLPCETCAKVKHGSGCTGCDSTFAGYVAANKKL